MRRSANVEEHPKGSGKHRVRARVSGKLKTLISGVSFAEAETVADAYETYQVEAHTVASGLTVAQFGIGFLDRRERAGIRGIRSDRSYWKVHVEADELGELPVETLERRDIVDWRDRRGARAHRTKVKALNLLTVALDDAVDRGLLKANPARGVKVHRSDAARATDDLEGILAPAEQRALIAAIPDHASKALVTFALCTGLRQAEQWWLHWTDVGDDRIVVKRSTGGKPPKSGKPREVFLLPPARTALEAISRRSPFVFPAQRGSRRPEGMAPRGWSEWLSAAGIKRRIRWHDLRHTCATSLLAGWWGRKWTLDEVCKLLGHSSIAVTERYARKLNETQQIAVSQTPMAGFPGMLPKSTKGAILLEQASGFVKHRSRVQISQSAPILTEHSGERSGNDDPELEAFLVALRDQAERGAAAEAFRESDPFRVPARVTRKPKPARRA